jgi:hypothetical protein
MEMLPNPSVVHLMPFFKYFSDFVDRLILTDCPLGDDALMKVSLSVSVDRTRLLTLAFRLATDLIPTGYRPHSDWLPTSFRNITDDIRTGC